MTYQEIKDRLAKCEFSLKCIADGTYKKIKKEKLSETTKKLTILKESLQKQLKEAEGTVRTADSGEAEKLSKKGVDVDLVEPKDLETNEQEGSSFDQNETAKIAAEVGKATVLALKGEGENISTARAKRIKPNQFDLLIGFNNGNENLYEFYIVGDTLYLKDTSYDREISDVGVQQSGEAIINVDVVKDQLQKYFKTVNTALGEAERVKKVGEMTDQEFADAQEKDRLEKHPEKDIIKKIQFLVQKEREKRKLKEEEGGDRHYLKVPRTQYKKAQKVIDDVLRNDVYGGHKLDIVDNDGRGNVIFYFMGPEEKAITYDAIVYLRNSDVDVVDSSISDMEEGDGMTTKIKLSAGDPTNMAYTDKVSENADQDEALDRLRDIVGRVEELGEEARDIVRQNFPNELSRMDGYGVFNMVYSNNRYDTTLGSEVDRLEDYGYDDLDDDDYPMEGKELKEGTDLYDGDKFSMNRFAGPNGIALQITAPKLKGGGYEYIQIDGDDVKEFARAAVHVAQEFHDIDRQIPVNEYVLGSRHGSLVMKFKDLEAEIKKIEDEGDFVVRRKSNPSDKVQHEWEIVPIGDVSSGEEKSGIRIYDYKFPFDPAKHKTDQTHSFSVGGVDKMNTLSILKHLFGPEAKAAYGDINMNDIDPNAWVTSPYGQSEMNEDTDIGHQDDEPGMLKSTAYEAATFAAKLYKKLAKYDQFDGEVDFPNWWQSKLILSKDYLSKAFHYLDSEEKQPIIDKLALEGKNEKKGS